MRREDVLLTLEALTAVNGEWVPEFLIPLSMEDGASDPKKVRSHLLALEKKGLVRHAEGTPGRCDLWGLVG